MSITRIEFNKYHDMSRTDVCTNFLAGMRKMKNEARTNPEVKQTVNAYLDFIRKNHIQKGEINFPFLMPELEDNVRGEECADYDKNNNSFRYISIALTCNDEVLSIEEIINKVLPHEQQHAKALDISIDKFNANIYISGFQIIYTPDKPEEHELKAVNVLLDASCYCNEAWTEYLTNKDNAQYNNQEVQKRIDKIKEFVNSLSDTDKKDFLDTVNRAYQKSDYKPAANWFLHKYGRALTRQEFYNCDFGTVLTI